MKLLLENWREYLTEDKRTISFDEVIELLRNDPDQERSLDFRAGEGHKSFGGVFDPRILVPFDYGEFPELINAADNMGWDFIIASESNVEDKNLQPVGHVGYYEDDELWDSHEVDMPENIGGNSKIVLANDGEISGGEKAHLTEFFGPMWQFKEPEWYETSDGTRVFRTDGGKIEVMENSKWAGGAHSILSFFVDEDKRGQGIGQKLIQMVLAAYPDEEISAQVSSPASLKAFMNLGFVPPEKPDASYDEGLELFNNNLSSLNVRINLGRNK